MAAITLATALTATAAAASAIGAGVQFYGAMEQRDISKKQEAVRQDAMQLDAQRKRREILRQTAMARSQALATATVQGAAGAGGSALPGAYGQIAGQAGNSYVGVNQAESQGNAMFALNRQAADASVITAAGQTAQSIGQGLFQLGGSLGQAQQAINSIGGQPSSRQRPIDLSAFGGPVSW